MDTPLSFVNIIFDEMLALKIPRCTEASISAVRTKETKRILNVIERTSFDRERSGFHNLGKWTRFHLFLWQNYPSSDIRILRPIWCESAGRRAGTKTTASELFTLIELLCKVAINPSIRVMLPRDFHIRCRRWIFKYYAVETRWEPIERFPFALEMKPFSYSLLSPAG